MSHDKQDASMQILPLLEVLDSCLLLDCPLHLVRLYSSHSCSYYVGGKCISTNY